VSRADLSLTNFLALRANHFVEVFAAMSQIDAFLPSGKDISGMAGNGILLRRSFSITQATNVEVAVRMLFIQGHKVQAVMRTILASWDDMSDFADGFNTLGELEECTMKGK
jgi:hypothetical protein